ncbi:hypothetical protein V8C86DRAFT_2953653 [Haematococcus lacustris]
MRSYSALGDLAVLGSEPPSRPVRMYKYSSGHACSSSGSSGLGRGVGSGDAPSEGPRLACPASWSLVYRDSATPPLTLWRPVPPRGYVEVGCVAWPEIEEPPLAGLVACVRRDLAAPARVYASPVWAGVSSDNQFWRGFIWPVDSPVLTFVASNGSSRPAAAFAPVY